MSVPGPLSPLQRRAHLSSAAVELGFDLFGVADARPVAQDRSRLLEWLLQGFQAGMGWMARDPQRRSDVQNVMPGARSVVSVAVNYYHPCNGDETVGGCKVSRYARGEDYHRVLGGKLRELKRTLDELAPGSQSVTYVDTGPIMEKAWAERAGLGWIGKNGNLITRSHGSWVFLGEIITTVELPPDEPHFDFCGSCTRCIEACPTDAIVEPCVVDSNRCISYWTIEHRGDFPDGIAGELDGWLFGCDVCQDVCPWNRFSTPTREEAFSPRVDCVNPPVGRWSQLSAEEFREEFADSAIRRCKPEGLKRNIQAGCNDPLSKVLQGVDTKPESASSGVGLPIDPLSDSLGPKSS